MAHIRNDPCRAEARFKARADHLAEQIKSQVMHGEDGLLGLAAMIRVVLRLSHQDFQTYVSGLDLPRRFPGIRGFGLIAKVAPGELDAFRARARADSGMDLQPGVQRGARHLLLVRFLDPPPPNRGVWGVDIASEPVRREAAERATTTGKIALSAPVVLAEDATMGWLLFLPVHAGPVPAAATDLQALLFAPILVGDVLGRVRAQSDGDVEFRLSDAHGPKDAALYDSRVAGGGATGSSSTLAALSPMFEDVRHIEVAGRTFDVRFHSTPQLESEAGRLQGGLVTLVGIFLTALLALAMRRLHHRGN